MTLQKRERVLLVLAAAGLLFWAVRSRLKSVFFGPIQERQTQQDDLERQAVAKTRELVRVKRALGEVQTWRARSLPPRAYVGQRLYQEWLTDLGQMAELRELKVKPGRRIPRELYTAVLVSVEAEATLQSLKRFLYYFYRTDLAHRLAGLTAEPQAHEGDPVFEISLLAEGLVFSGIEDRPVLFPQTTLTSEFNSLSGEKQVIEVADPRGFPKKRDFRIRIGREYLTVNSVDGSRWEVIGGVDATRPSRHAAGETVELAPVHPDYADRSFDDFQSLVAGSLFVKPPPDTGTLNSEPVTPTEDAAANTRLIGYVDQDGQLEAWLRNSLKSEVIRVRKGSRLSIADIEAVVVKIGYDYLLLQNGEGTWRLQIDESLRDMEKVAEPADSTDADGSEKTPQTEAVSQSQAGTSDR